MTVDEQNERLLALAARYLNGLTPVADPEEVRRLSRQTGMTEGFALAVLFARDSGLNIDGSRDDMDLFMNQLLPSIRKEDPFDYENDPYLRRVPFPRSADGTWRTLRLSYRPCELFPCGDAHLRPDGRLIQPLGFFDRAFSFPAIFQGEDMWMSVTPNEINTMKGPVSRARGLVLTGGVGLGYYAFRALDKDEVTHVTVVERDESALRLFRDRLLPSFPHPEKLTLLQADAFDVIGRGLAGYDCVFWDLWHNVSDGLPLYQKLKALEESGIRYDYWLEDTLKLYL